MPIGGQQLWARVTSSVFWESPPTTRHDTISIPFGGQKFKFHDIFCVRSTQKSERLNPSARLKRAQSGLQRQLDPGGTRPGQVTKSKILKEKAIIDIMEKIFRNY